MVGGRSAHPRSTSTLRRCAAGSADGSRYAGSSASSAGSTTTSVSGRPPSSRSSLVVKRACEGPRRPTIWISRTWLPASAARAACGMSVALSSAAPRARIRVTSTATFPTPMTTAARAPTTKPSDSTSGCALYQDTKSVADQLPGNSSPGTPRRRSVAAPTQYTTAW